jgi:hypothetical protein
MAPRQHPGWRPDRLRHHREAHGLTLDQAAEAIRNLASQGVDPPDATFQMVGRHERGEVYPGPRYRRAYRILYSATESELGFRFALPGESTTPHAPSAAQVEDEDLRRRDLLRSVAGTPALIAPPPLDVTESGCLHWMAWTMWERNTSRLHESDLPGEIRRTLGRSFQVKQSSNLPRSVVSSSILLRDNDGNYTFTHPSLMDLFNAQAVFSDIAAGRLTRISATQTSHRIDTITSDFVSADEGAVKTLGDWMRRGTAAVTRVNSAGILAKVESPALADEVITALRRDTEARDRYVVAVIMRLLRLDWSSSLSLARDLASGSLLSDDQSAKIATKFAREIRNPRDVGARWSSVLVLSRLGTAGVATATPALAEALSEESSRETLRAIGLTLAGADPLAS